MTNRTNKALLERRALAEKAIQGSWGRGDSKHLNTILAVRENEHCNQRFQIAVTNLGLEAEAAHIAANSPDVVMEDIDEILRLRAENARLEKEADWLAVQLANGLIDPCLIEYLHGLSNGLCHSPTPEMLLEAARKFVEKSNDQPH